MTVAVPVTESSQVAEARRQAAAVAAEVGLPEIPRANLAIVVTELATNLIKHVGGGEILLDALPAASGGGVRVISSDTGAGIANVHRSLEDGYSSAGSSGTGLGAVRRLASEFDLWTAPGRGAVLAARIADPGRGADPAGGAPPGAAVAGVSTAMKGETVCGDAWAAAELAGRTVVLVADGLGHGLAAADASGEAVRVFLADPSRPPREQVERIHGALRSTRGAAVAVADVDASVGVVRYSGIGNIAGAVAAPAGTRRMVSHNGTAGQLAPRIHEFQYPWDPGSLLVMHSDGLTTRWDLADYPGLAERRPAVVAGVLHRDHTRGRDDATVVVLRGAGR